MDWCWRDLAYTPAATTLPEGSLRPRILIGVGAERPVLNFKGDLVVRHGQEILKPAQLAAAGLRRRVRGDRPDLRVAVQLQRESSIPESDQVLGHLQLHREVEQVLTIVDENRVIGAAEKSHEEFPQPLIRDFPDGHRDFLTSSLIVTLPQGLSTRILAVTAGRPVCCGAVVDQMAGGPTQGPDFGRWSPGSRRARRQGRLS